ncbi:hypothetical protein ACIBL3_10635 [Kribbella sp. NPDC050124]|uniref:hypothetical protein n=1 Tax=Kribbella sp. NPDC050124 TaxID=3364114 RepID=UPI0037ACA6E2
MDADDSGRPPDLDEAALRRLPPPNAAHRIPEDRLHHLDDPDAPDPDEEEPWWRRETGG